MLQYKGKKIPRNIGGESLWGNQQKSLHRLPENIVRFMTCLFILVAFFSAADLLAAIRLFLGFVG